MQPGSQRFTSQLSYIFCLKSKSHKNTLIQVLREVKDRSPFSWHTAYRIPFEASAASAAVSVAPWPAVPPLPRASTKSKMDTRRTETLADVENSMLKTWHFLQLKWCANKDNLSSQCLVLARHLGMDLDMGVPGHFLLFDCFHHFMHSMHTNHKGTDDKGNCKAAVSWRHRCSNSTRSPSTIQQFHGFFPIEKKVEAQNLKLPSAFTSRKTA